MRRHQVRGDLVRERVGEYSLPLGLEPLDLPEPAQGYVLDYVPGEEDPTTGEPTPDTYSFQVTVSHERLLPILADAIRLLGDEVIPVLEVGSRDAFRALDVFMASEPIPAQAFCEGFDEYRAVLLEDANVGIGANSEEPYVEVFLDCWKGLLISVPIAMRRTVERALARHGLREVVETWPLELDRRSTNPTKVREVLLVDDDRAPDFEEVLMQLRERFAMELSVDPSTNLDDAGRTLGRTLWHVIAMAEHSRKPDHGAYVNMWLTATCLEEVEELAQQAVEAVVDLRYAGLYTSDRVAFDERPEALNDLPPRHESSDVLAVDVDYW